MTNFRDEAENVLVRPTAERAAHNPVIHIARQIQDSQGNPGAPFKVVDTLDAMLSAKTINEGQYVAGLRFRDDFDLAGLQPVKASSIERLGHSPDQLTDKMMDARGRVYRVMIALGGFTTPSGSLVWHVLGEQWSIRRWCQTPPFRLRPSTAGWMLVNCLELIRISYEAPEVLKK